MDGAGRQSELGRNPVRSLPGLLAEPHSFSLVLVLAPHALLLRLLGHVFRTHLASLALSKKTGQSYSLKMFTWRSLDFTHLTVTSLISKTDLPQMFA